MSSSAYGHDSTANGDFSAAYGVLSTASGEASAAFGAGAMATGTNSFAAGANAIAGGASSIAVGDGAAANANGTAIGAGAFAAGSGDVAIGQGARVEADNSSAFGAGATVLAAHTNSTAVGAGATTTRANQVMLGTGGTTYTAAGITSDASKQAQGSPTHIVTSNASGDLAAYTPSQLGLASPSDVARLQSDVTRLQTDVSGLQSEIDHLGRRDNELTEGIAAVVSLAQPILEQGQSFGMTAAWGGFDDASAFGVSAAGVIARNLLRPGGGTLALFGGVGVGANEGTVAGRAGVSFGW